MCESFGLQTMQTPSSLWNQSSSFCCNSHPTQGLSVWVLDFEAPFLILSLFLMPDQKVSRHPRPVLLKKKMFHPQIQGAGGGMCWERGEAVRMLPVKTDFSPPHKKGKLISLNSVFICKTEPLQKCLSKLPEFIPLIRALPCFQPRRGKAKKLN